MSYLIGHMGIFGSIIESSHGFTIHIKPEEIAVQPLCLDNGAGWADHERQPLCKLIPPRGRDQQAFLGLEAEKMVKRFLGTGWRRILAVWRRRIGRRCRGRRRAIKLGRNPDPTEFFRTKMDGMGRILQSLPSGFAGVETHSS